MGVIPTYKASDFRPISTDPNLRNRIIQRIDGEHGVPMSIPPEYPERGNTIFKKAYCYVNGPGENQLVLEPSPLKEQVMLEDMAVVLGFYGNSTTRANVAKTFLEELLNMNPLPRIVLVEGLIDGQKRLEAYGGHPNVLYLSVDLQNPDYRNLFMKESLWNIGANSLLDMYPEIRKLVFLDMDVVYADKMSFQEVYNSLDTYDIVSPFRGCYYLGKTPDAKKYGMLQSIGLRVVANSRHAGWQGFGIGMTVEFYDRIHRELPTGSLGFGDCIFWWLAIHNSRIRDMFRLIPYDRAKLNAYAYPEDVKIGFSNTVLQHLDHGPIEDRQYQVKCTLMRCCVREPFEEMTRTGSSMLLKWSDSPAAEELRHCVENLLIANRKDVRITTEEDAKEFHAYLTGRRPCPPDILKKNIFALHENRMPMAEVAIPVPDRYPTL